MPPSDAERRGDSPADPSAVPGYALAVTAEALYIVNLMLAPGLAFLVLAWLWHTRRADAPPLARCHLEQTFVVSLWGGVLIVLATTLLVLAGGMHWGGTWVIVILYFTTIHSTLILLGVLGLARALSGKPFHYPLIGGRHAV